MKLVVTLIPALSLCVLAGCGVAAKVNARRDMEQSKASYKACLAIHPTDGECEALRLAYEADLKAYRATSAGIQPGDNSTINVNTSSDQQST